MACDCIRTLDAQLKPYNTRLGVTLVFGKTSAVYPTLVTEQVEKGRGKAKAKAMLPTFCPFCGVKYDG